jgi:hypothetical protein
LVRAVRRDRINEVRMHLKNGVDINSIDNNGPKRILDSSSRGGYIYRRKDIVVELLKHDNLDVNLQNTHCDTALTRASFDGYSWIVFDLLKHGKVDVNLQNRDDDTALRIASQFGHRLTYDPSVVMTWTIAKGPTEVAMCRDEHAKNGSRCNDEKQRRLDTEEAPARKKKKSQRPLYNSLPSHCLRWCCYSGA